MVNGPTHKRRRRKRGNVEQDTFKEHSPERDVKFTLLRTIECKFHVLSGFLWHVLKVDLGVINIVGPEK